MRSASGLMHVWRLPHFEPPSRRADRQRGDRGSQYAAEDYRAELAKHGLNGSMGRRDNPYDNAKAESFMKTLKVEEVYLMEYELSRTSPPLCHASSKWSIMPSVGTRRSDSKVLSNLKRNMPGRSPIERHHACPPPRGALQFRLGSVTASGTLVRQCCFCSLGCTHWNATDAE
jgi:hypothetical protein